MRSSTGRFVSPGLSIILFYFCLTYLLPSVYSSVLDLSVVSAYKIYPVQIWVLAVVLSMSMALIICDDRGYFRERPTPVSLPPGRDIRLGLAVTFVAVGVLSLLQGLNGFRYSEQSSFADGNIVVYLLSLAPVTIKFDLLLQLFYRTETEDSRKELTIRILFLIALLLTSSGTASALFALLYLGYTVSPHGFRFLVTNQAMKFNWGRILFLGTSATLVLIVGWTIGESIKRNGNYESVIRQVSEPGFLNWFSVWLLDRFSSSYYSTLMAVHDYLVRVDLKALENLLVPLKSLAYRLDVILGRPYEVMRPETVSIMRLNYELLALEVNPREGTSPGLLGGFLLCFPFLLNLVAPFGYCWGLVRMFNRLIRSTVSAPNRLGILLYLFLGLVFFESPIDFLLIIDDATFSLLLFGWLLWRASKWERGVLKQRPSFAYGGR